MSYIQGVHHYAAFGLSLGSELSFTELAPQAEGAAAPSVFIRRGPVDPGEGPKSGDKSYVEVHPAQGETVCVYEGVGRFLASRGKTITVDALEGVDSALVRHALLGPVMAPLLWQRGLFTLHASVIQVGERAVAFVAASGEGKSTVAAALYFAGHALVADDMAAIATDQSPLCVPPAFPRLRAFPDTLRGLGQDPDAQPRVHALLDKCSVIVERYAPAPVPLAAVYVVETGPTVAIAPLDRKAALMQLMRHTYAAYQLAPIVGFGNHLKMAGKVAEHVPCFTLRRPRDFAALSELVASVEEHTLR